MVFVAAPPVALAEAGILSCSDLLQPQVNNRISEKKKKKFFRCCLGTMQYPLFAAGISITDPLPVQQLEIAEKSQTRLETI